MLKQFAFVACLLTAACAIALPVPADRWVVAKVFDGDTVALVQQDMPWTIIRLAGIDAPEKKQEYGQASREALEALLKGCEIHFAPIAGDRYGRTVARISACGRDVNSELVREGAAWVYLAYPHSSADVEAEAEAKASRKGLWANDGQIPPWEFRRLH